MNIKNNEIKILLGALLLFITSLLFLFASLLPPFHLFYLNYSFLGLSGGLLFLSYDKYFYRRYQSPIISSKLIIRFILPLLIIIDCALFYAYYGSEKIEMFNDVVNIKEYYGLYILIVSSWIGIILFLKKKK